MAEQLLSTDPQAGQLLSADPRAGVVTEAHPEARMSARAPGAGGLAFPGDADDVTFEDLRADPIDALTRIGAIVKQDVSDPTLWLSLAASYFGPKVFNRAAPVVMKAANGAINAASRVRVDPAVAMEEFSLVKPLRVLKAVSVTPKTPEMTTPGYDRFLPSKSGYVAPAGGEPAPEPAAAAPSEFQAARSARANALPDQKALNEAALAARRAAYQASQQPAADTVVKASGKLHFTAPEWAAFRELRARGVGLEDAATGARAAGQLARQFGLTTPTLEQTRFPKAK